MQLNFKKDSAQRWGTFLLLLLAGVSRAQTMTRQDKLFIQKGIQYQSWIRVDGASEDNPVPVTTTLNISRTGRYVKIQLSGTDPLSLAEVQVFSAGVNVAQGKTTQQSSDLGGATSSRAVDGNTNGNYSVGSVTHTIDGYAAIEPWWQVDLGSIVTIDSIRIWNRTDCCDQRLKGFYLFVSNAAFTNNSLVSTFAQSGVSYYMQPGADHYPSGNELANSHFAPTYYERPMYNYAIHQQNPTVQWGLVKGPFGLHVDRGPSVFETSNGFLNSLQAADSNLLSSICFGDEEGYSTTLQNYMRDWFAVSRSKYPNVLVHNNQYTGQWSEANLRTYLQTAKPDLLTYDYYYFFVNRNPGAGGSQAAILQDMYTYRKLALEGYDGSGASPIAFGAYLQGYKGSRNGGSYNYYPSESEFNIGVYSFLIMGAKWMNSFRYIGGNNTFFWTDQNGTPTAQYWQNARLGAEVLHLSPHLSRLRTKDVRFIAGQHISGTSPVNNAGPASIAAWDSTAGPYISSISATNLVSATNNGLKGDVVVGYFKPVPGINSTSGITMAPVPSASTAYFMIMNGLAVSNGCCNAPGTTGILTDTIQGKANLATQKITLNINFGTYPVDTLFRVRRKDGVVEKVNLTLVSGKKYVYNDTLDGGLADLFYWKNAGTVVVPAANLALNKTATQSSDHSSTTGLASLAVDGNTNGDYFSSSVTSTADALTNQPWWQVDLGASANIQTINIYNRTDCCGSRLANYHIFISDVPFTSSTVAGTQAQAGVQDYFQTATAGSPSVISINNSGRYVRIQLQSTNVPLSLAEVQVMGNFPVAPLQARTAAAVENTTAFEPASVKDGKVLSCNVYPNPLTGTELTVSLSAPAAVQTTLKIYDLKGREMLTKSGVSLRKGNNSIRVQTGELTPGIYFLHIGVRGSNVVKKFVVLGKQD
ncbi:galactose-binding domain-containing protein [Chitinophaga arvensicola]|uniref:Por secretion system C-terminal sorting domain-containing protein n=1 Tax=Chitinophaga arvensicola TaxID=29529 RepID=A0A1I0S6Z9_9BACT|nr:discoidin domain-containing protein [Chitinophaga arvensicola]SEW51488.1 Por secretion system C-terminal sorting domain-containing protein [Chitinophaga arvensicola]